MEIIKIKQQESGYLVNDTMSVPNDENNRHYEMVQEAIANGVVVEPEFTEEELLLQEQAAFRRERDELLKEVDITIYKFEDNGLDSSVWRMYRQALRDATETWVMPSEPSQA